MRKLSQHELDCGRRENNFVGVAGFRMAISTDKGIFGVIDLAFAFQDSAGAASLAWTSPPSFSDSRQVLAHSKGYVAELLQYITRNLP